jgi:hypothetical protein
VVLHTGQPMMADRVKDGKKRTDDRVNPFSPFISYPDRQGEDATKDQENIEETTMSIQDTDMAFSWLMHNLSVFENLPIS